MPRKQWSFSQSYEIRRCERRWFLSKGHRATIRSRDPFLREIAFLKKLRPAFMWRGEIIHDAIAAGLHSLHRRSSRQFDAAYAIDTAIRWADAQWADSERRASAKDPRPSVKPEGPILFEHFFRPLQGTTDLATVKQDIVAALRAFGAWAGSSGVIDQVKAAQRVWIEPLPPPAFPIDDVQFLTKVDLAVQLRDRFLIYDWKTGKIPDDAIAAHLVFLGDALGAQVAEVRITLDQVPAVLWDLHLCVEAGRDVLEEKELYCLEDFDFASSAYTCQWCEFQELCRELLLDPGEHNHE
jgi:hypothetical protein